MKRLSAFALVGLIALGCSDSSTGVPASSYTLESATPQVSLGQDSSATLVINVKRTGTDTTIKGVRLVYSSADYNIATVDGTTGLVTGVGGGSTTIRASLANATVDVPVTVRARPATSVELTILTGPAGGLKSVNADTGTFYALPADNLTARLKAVVRVGNDTVFCNFCTTKTPARVMRIVRFRSLNPTLATISNANTPNLQASTDTTGRITVSDTTSAGVRFVLEVPADNKADTVLVKFTLRPIDSIAVRPDSNFFPTTNGTGLQKQIYPNADLVQANVKAAATTNFIAGLDYLSRVVNAPAPATPNTPGATRFIPSRLVGAVTVARPQLPNVTWESANRDYLDVNAAGSVTGKCAAIGGSCVAIASSVLSCNSTSGAMPSTFLGTGTYTIPSCSPAKTIPMPGALCTSSSASDLSSTCTVWIRASANDQVTGKLLRTLYRVNIGR